MSERLTVDAEVVAKALGFSAVHIYRAAKRGAIPSIKLGGRVVFILEEVLDACRQGALAPRKLRKVV
jgi:predicted DNA-binding transcriptional regulator AlpA